MLDQGALTQQQTGGSINTTNPQSVPVSNLQPQQSSLQGADPQVLGTSTYLEQSSTSAISVNGQNVNQELDGLRTNQGVSTETVQSSMAGKELWVIGGTTLLIAILCYVLLKQMMREHA